MNIRNFFYFFFEKDGFHTLLRKFQGYIRGITIVCKNNPSAFFQLCIVTFALIYLAAHDFLNLIAMLILSILTCNILSKGNVFFKNDLETSLIYENKKRMVKSRFGILFFCTIFQFLVLSAYCPMPFTRSSFGEAFLWAFITTNFIILHYLVQLFYETLPKKSKIRFLLKNLTIPFIGNFIPLGSLLIYIMYLPYLCVYWIFCFSFKDVDYENVYYVFFTAILTPLLIIMVSCLYYKIAIYLMRKINALYSICP